MCVYIYIYIYIHMYIGSRRFLPPPLPSLLDWNVAVTLQRVIEKEVRLDISLGVCFPAADILPSQGSHRSFPRPPGCILLV